MKSDFFNFASDLAQKAGKIMTKNFSSGMEKTWKNDLTPLTVSDKKINKMVIDQVEKQYPLHSIISEEGSVIKKSEYAWICDPIDGTIPFSHGYPISVFCLALVKNGESILGVIFDPFMNRMVTAKKGEGAYMNNEKIHVSPTSIFKSSMIDVEPWAKGNKFDISHLNELLVDKQCFPTTIRSAAYAAMLVAMGNFAAVVLAGTNPWDGASLKIIIDEAGGKVTNLFGGEDKYNSALKGMIASNGLLHDQLLDLIRPLVQ